MRILITTLALYLFASLLMGQEKPSVPVTSGRITYEEKIRLEIKLEGDAAQYASMLPKERKSAKVLSFTPESTLFEETKDIEDEMSVEHGEGVRIKMIASGENKIFTDLKNSRMTEQRDFMNRIFLVEKDIPVSGWKITGNQKVILGYPCMEAFRQDTAGVRTTVWFAPSITVKGGPAGFSNLPGMVLEADINEGSRTYIAKSVEQIPAKDLKIEKPKEGKKVTEEEFMAVMAEKMKELGIEEGHAGGATHMRVVIRQ